MKNIIYLLLPILFLCLISCEKNEVDESKFILSTLLGTNENFNNIFYVNKQVVAYPWSYDLRFRTWDVSGRTKNQSVSEFSVNGVDIPKTTTTGFYKYFGREGATEIQQGIYEIKVDDRTYSIEDIGIQLVTIGGTLIKGESISWEMENYEGEVMVLIKQNAIKKSGEVIPRPKFEYAFTTGTNFRVPDQMLERFNTGEEVTISVGIANYVKDEDGIYAVVAHSHTDIMKVLLHE